MQRIFLIALALVFVVGIASAQDSVRLAYFDAGKIAMKNGKYDEAERLFRSAIKEADSAGKQDDIYAQSLSYLGRVYWYKAKYAEAEPLIKRAIELEEKVEGTEGTNVAAMLGSLASLYHDQGKLAEAESLFKRCLKIEEKAFGPNHREVATTVHNLARLYAAQGQFVEAEALYRRSLQIQEAHTVNRGGLSENGKAE